MKTTPARMLAAALLTVGLAAEAQVPFVAQTAPVPTATSGDVAIVWEPGLVRRPLVAVCDPLQNGLYAYDTDGGLVQVLPYGPVAGADVRVVTSPDGGPVALVAAAAAVAQALVFSAWVDAGLVDVTGGSVPAPTAGAVALHQWPDGGLEALVDTSAGAVRRIALRTTDAGAVVGTVSGLVTLPASPSALVVDDRAGTAYAALPFGGVYSVALEPETVELLIPLDGGRFDAPVSGLTFYPLSDGGGLLLTTVPSSDEVVVHALAGPGRATYVTRFRVEVGAQVVRAPRSVDVIPNRLVGFDAGLFVIQDTLAANAKLVPWDLLAASTPEPLPVEVPEDHLAPAPDAGLEDGGSPDGGAADGGASDGGRRDGGTPGGGGGGIGGPPGGPLECSGCCCRAVDTAVLMPGLLALWAVRVNRRRRVRGA